MAVRSLRLLSFKGTATLLSIIVWSFFAVAAQSTDQSFPTPVSESQIEATIRARDVGDPRLTTHFWSFDGSQGDIFINVVTRNFSGDIDVYQAETLKPLTKMVVFADSGVTETGRVIYMRQPGHLLLRVEGRSPNDDPARYTIKFAGSFVAMAPEREVKPPTVGSSEETGIRVNSVGTIVAVKPKATPTPPVVRPDRTRASVEDQPARRVDNEDHPEQPPTETRDPDSSVKTVFGNRSAKVTVSKPDGLPPAKSTATAAPRKTNTAQRSSAAATRPKNEPVPDPLANVHLIILLKDGSRVEKVMTEILRFSYDRGYLTVIARDGAINRYSMAAVASVTVQ